MHYEHGRLIFSPSDLIRFLASPFSSWMDRYHLENPRATEPDKEKEEQKLIAQTGNDHEAKVISEFRKSIPGLVEIGEVGFENAQRRTLEAVHSQAPLIYQAALNDTRFRGFADFLILDDHGRYQAWDAKLARSPKPYFPVQLCCYSEMLAETTQQRLPERMGVILGTGERAEFKVEDFIYYYRRLRANFLELQDGFTSNLADRPEPLPRADHGRWESHAHDFFASKDHLSSVANITVGQIKKLQAVSVTTVRELAQARSRIVPKLAVATFDTLVAQARLQILTRDNRILNPQLPPCYELLPVDASNGRCGFAALPARHSADVFFDMEGYPLAAGGLEYLFGAYSSDTKGAPPLFLDWWADSRDEEKLAFEGFIDWVFRQWLQNPGMHIYHYASYETSALKRLSTQHNTRQDELDELLRHQVFVDLFQIVRHSLRIGEDNYSIKTVEKLYRPGRTTQIATASDSIVQYAQWMVSGQSGRWQESEILRAIRAYNEDDCVSTAMLAEWLRSVAAEHGVETDLPAQEETAHEPNELNPKAKARLRLAAQLRERTDSISQVLCDLVDFHRREDKPMWWRMFARSVMTPQELRDDPCCIEAITAVGVAKRTKRSQVQTYGFDPSQDCKLRSDDEQEARFCGDLDSAFTIVGIDYQRGELQLKKSSQKLMEECGGAFPSCGSLLPYEHVPKHSIPGAIAAVAEQHLQGRLNVAATALLSRAAPDLTPSSLSEKAHESAVRICGSMNGGCLVIQGPPGTGKTFTAAHMILALVRTGNRVGVVSNSHKAVINLLEECGKTFRETGALLTGVKVGGEGGGAIFDDNPGFRHIAESKNARDAYTTGIIGGTAWLFTRPEWENSLDFLFIDEAGQVSLANTVAMTRCTRNLVLLGDQMQLEQPIQGVHPGDSGLSGLQYALKDTAASRPDVPAFHAVVPRNAGLFLGESRRMHPSVCRFISGSIYDGRLTSHEACARQRICAPHSEIEENLPEHGIVFVAVEHDGNTQQSDEVKWTPNLRH